MKIIVSKKEAEELSQKKKIIFYDKNGSKYKYNTKKNTWEINEFGYGRYYAWEYCTHTNTPKILYTLNMKQMAEKLQEYLDDTK